MPFTRVLLVGRKTVLDFAEPLGQIVRNVKSAEGTDATDCSMLLCKKCEETEPCALSVFRLWIEIGKPQDRRNETGMANSGNAWTKDTRGTRNFIS